MIYYLYYTHQFIRNGAWTAMNTAKAIHGSDLGFFQRNEAYAGEQGRSFSFWLGADGDPN